MNASTPYAVVVIFEKSTIILLETSVANDERELELRIDNRLRGLLRLAIWDLPRISVGQSELLVWGGTRIYVLDLAEGLLRQFDLEDQVCEAYRLDDCWCLICETSVLLWSAEDGEILAERLHDEILLNAWWDSDHLFVEDLQGRKLEIQPEEMECRVSLRLVE